MFNQSPSAAAAFAHLQREVEARKERESGAASSTGRTAGSSSSSRGMSAAAGAAAGAPAGSSEKKKSASAVKAWVCIVCGVEKPCKEMFACSGCKAVKKRHFCSRDCQRADWPHHKAACKKAQEATAARSTGGSQAPVS